MPDAPLRILVLVRSHPYPPIGGVPLRNWQNICALQQLGEVSLFSIFKAELVKVDLAQPSLADQGIATWSHYNIGAPRRPRSEKLLNRLRWLRPDAHYYIDWIYTDSAARQLTQVLAQVRPTHIVFEEVWFYRYWLIAQRYAQSLPATQRPTLILDNHNVESLLVPDRLPPQAGKNWGERLDIHLRPGQMRRVERRFLAGVDQVWACSALDKTLMQQCYGVPAEKIWVVPNAVAVGSYAEAVAASPAEAPAESSAEALAESGAEAAAVSSAETAAKTRTGGGAAEPSLTGSAQTRLGGPRSLLFLASFGYKPNADAAQQLIEQIYPLVKAEEPDIRLLLVGQEPTALMQRAAAQDPAITVTGRVADVRPYLQQAALLVVPLQGGSGTRLKILEAFAAGCPVVSTPKGVEGIEAQDGLHLLVRDSAEAIALGILELGRDSALAERLAASAHRLVTQYYSWDAVQVRIREAIGGASVTEL